MSALMPQGTSTTATFLAWAESLFAGRFSLTTIGQDWAGLWPPFRNDQGLQSHRMVQGQDLKDWRYSARLASIRCPALPRIYGAQVGAHLPARQGKHCFVALGHLQKVDSRHLPHSLRKRAVCPDDGIDEGLYPYGSHHVSFFL